MDISKFQDIKHPQIHYFKNRLTIIIQAIHFQNELEKDELFFQNCSHQLNSFIDFDEILCYPFNQYFFLNHTSPIDCLFNLIERILNLVTTINKFFQLIVNLCLYNLSNLHF